jgi:uncharacterized protein (DUF302 family)
MTAPITRESPVGFDETLSRLNATLTARGLTVFAHVDHAASAREAGLHMPLTTVVIFGNARGGTPLMLVQPDIALDLPLRILIRDEDGRTLLSYHDPVVQAAEYGIGEELSGGLGKAIEAVVTAVLAGT